jgi:O-antigen/teichoic acid export membrane protein
MPGPSPTPSETEPGDARAHIAADARAISRALGTQVLGYVVKAGLPLLLALATQAYGVQWGVFVALQSLVLIAVRVAVGGLDKALLWWVGAHDPREIGRALWPSVAIVSAGSLAVSALIAVLGRAILAHWDGTSVDQLPALTIMLLGLPLMGVTDVLLHAAMGQRRMGPQVAIRDTLVPISWLLAALLFHAIGWRETGLCWAFVVSQALGLVAAIGSLGRLRATAAFSLRPPPDLLRFALPSWLNEIANSTLLRIDVLILAALADPLTVGIWGLIVQFGNAMRSIRRAFDPILIAVVADISKQPDRQRLAEALSYATQLVFLSQHPVFVFLLLFGTPLLTIYGSGFDAGGPALSLLAAFWLLNGATSLSGTVIAGYGHARWALFMTLLGIAIEVPLLWVLVPRYGLVGAAIAVGAMNTTLQQIQLREMKRVSGGWPYTARAFRPLGPALWSGAAALGGWWLGGVFGAGLTPSVVRLWAAPGLSFICFAAVYGGLVLRQWRQGRLRAPGALPAPARAPAAGA